MQQLRELVEWVVLAAMHSRMATTKVPLAELVETVAMPQPELLVPAVQEAEHLVPKQPMCKLAELVETVAMPQPELLVPAVQAELVVPAEPPRLQLAELVETVAMPQPEPPELAAPVAQAESRWQQVLPLYQMVVTVVTVELVAPAAMAAMAAMLTCMATTKVSLMVAMAEMAEMVRQLAAQVVQAVGVQPSPEQVTKALPEQTALAVQTAKASFINFCMVTASLSERSPAHLPMGKCRPTHTSCIAVYARRRRDVRAR
jgi:hypothetical protein